MEFLTIREFATSLRASQDKLDRDGKIVLTNNGKPIALAYILLIITIIMNR